MDDLKKTNENIVGADEITSVYADYRYNKNDIPKFDYGKDPHNYEEGYTFFHQKSLKNIKDEAFSNKNYFTLLNQVAMTEISAQHTVDPMDLTVWIFLLAPNGLYLGSFTDADGVTRVYADTTYENLSQRNVFRINKHYLDKKKNIWGFVISQGKSHMSILFNKDSDSYYNNEFDIIMDDKERYDEDFLYHFDINRTQRPDVITINTKFTPPWKTPWPKSQPQSIKRFFSLYDQQAPKYKFNNDPKTCGYPPSYAGSKPDMLKCIGNAYWSGYSKFSNTNKDLKRISNNYLFRIDTDVIDLNEKSILMGFDGKVRWVKYYNETYHKIYNDTVDPKIIIDNVKPSLLFESAYESDIGEPSEKTKKIKIDNDINVEFKLENETNLKNSHIELKSVVAPKGNYLLTPKAMNKKEK